MAYVKIDDLRVKTAVLLGKWKIPLSAARLIADTIIYAHQHEKHTHGITRLPIYKRKIDQGWMSSDTPPSVVIDFAALAVTDGHDGFGQVIADFSMRLAIEKAHKFGVGIVFARNSNNFGVAGYFGNIALEAGMVGCVITASAPAIAPEGGTKSIFGTNPYCFAFPSSEGGCILDMAVSAAARGKVRLAQKQGEKIPLGWAVDKNGMPTTDPAAALLGNMLGIGGVKGFGLAMVADIFGGLLSGSSFGGDIKPLACETAPSRHGHFFMAIDISKLMPKDVYEQKMSELIHNIKACGEPGRIWIPGERSRLKADANVESVGIADKLINDFNELLKSNGIEVLAK